MTQNERKFLNDVLGAVDDWDITYDSYHENGDFCIDVTFNDMEEWGYNEEEIWDALSDVCDDWGAEINPDMNRYYICLG